MTDPEQKSSTHQSVITDCIECGQPLAYSGRGRRPRYCSSSCRHRAWEARRAAAEGKIAHQIITTDAPITTQTVAEWIADDPSRLARILAHIPDSDQLRSHLTRGLRRIDPTLELTDTRTLTDLHNDNHRLRRRVHTLTDEIDRLRHHTHERPAPTPPSSPHKPTPDALPEGYEQFEMKGKTFTVPAGWTRQQKRQWAKNNPTRGRTP